ncbi:signal peptidase II [bacterium]|nr:signal peptidase II [bacterium]
MVIVLLIALIVFGLDQVSKIIIINNLLEGHSIKVINNFFYITHLRNDGIAWGMEAKLWVLIIITIIALGLFIFFSWKFKWKEDKWAIFTIGFMMGGTLGNFFDRVIRAEHSVIDFLSFILYYPSFKDGFHFEKYDFPIFNIADTFLVIGAVMFIIYIFIIDRIKARKKAKEIDKDDVIDIKNE